MKPLPITAVILAAGQGRRLEPISLSHSKAMAPITGIPITELVIRKLRGQGFERFVLVVGRDDDDLESMADGLRGQGLSIQTAVQPEKLGTAHALLQARELIKEDFLLASCDNLYPEQCIRDMAEAFLKHRPPAVVASFKIGPGDLDRCAGVKLEGDSIIEIIEKPGEGSGPWDAVAKFFFVFDRGILGHLEGLEPSPRGEYEVQAALQKFLATQERPAKSVFVHDFLHLTSAQDLVRINRHYLENHTPFRIHERARVDKGAEIIDPVMVDEGAHVQAGSKIGPFVYVGKEAVIHAGARVRDTVVYPCAVIYSGQDLSGQVVLPSAERE